jgi:hypothetical protein
LRVCDRLSLRFASRLSADGEIAPLPQPDGSTGALRRKNNGDLSLILDPYPFDKPWHAFPIEAHLLPSKPYRNAEEFLAEIAKTAVTVLECKVSRDETPRSAEHGVTGLV